MIIKNLAPSDLDALYQLDQACFDKPWSKKSLEEELSHPDSICLGVRDCHPGHSSCHPGLDPGSKHDRLAAAILTRKLYDERWIFRIMTHPDFRRLGLAQNLIEHFDKDPLFLEVSEKNTGGIQFYKSLGFKVIAKRPNYYPETALVMKKN